jgi:peroxiredoxin Q/BCP
MLQTGQPAPDFNLKDSQGNSVSLKDFADRWLILYFYPKDNTPGCTTEAKDFTEYDRPFSLLGASIVGISTDSEQSHAKFSAKHDLSIALLSDPEHKVAEAYGIWQLKKFMGKEYMGIVRSTFLIAPDRTIARIWTKVKVKGHVEEVFNALQSLSTSA